MNSPHANPVLMQFVEGRVVSIDGLQRWFARAARYPGRARPEIEKGYNGWVERVRRETASFVTQIGVSPSRALRNAVATALPRDLHVWMHLLERDALGAFGSAADVRAVIEIAIARAPTRCDDLKAALAALPRASAASVHELLPVTRPSWHVTLALIEELPPADALGALSALVMECSGNQPDATDRAADRRLKRFRLACEGLLGRRPDVRFKAGAYGKLPERLRGGVTEPALWVSREGLKQMRVSARRRAARDAQMRTRHKVATDRCLAALTGLLSQRTEECWAAFADALVELAGAGGLRGDSECVSAIVSLLAGASADWVNLPTAPEAVQQRIAKACPESLGQTLCYLASPRTVQCRKHWGEITSEFEEPSLLLPVAMTRALLQCAVAEYMKNSGDRGRLWTLWGPHVDETDMGLARPIDPQEWWPAFAAGQPLGSAELDRFYSWLQLLPERRLPELESLHGPWLTHAVRDVEFVAHALSKTSGGVRLWLLGLCSPTRYSTATDAIAAEPDAAKRRALGATLQELLIEQPFGMPRGFGTIAARLVADGPSELGIGRTLELLGPAVDRDLWTTLLKGLDQSQLESDEVARVLVDALGSRPTPLARAMRQALRAEHAMPKGVLRSGWCAVFAASREEACKLLVRHPKAFLDIACAEAPTAWLIACAATKPGLAAQLAPHFDRKQLLRALPELRSELATRKRACAIAELAVLSDLREMDHLRAIAWASRGVQDPQPGCSLDSRYRTYELPKRSGGVRLITAPDDRLKRLQRRLLVGAFEGIPLHDAAHGFRTRRSIATNAAQHVGQRLIVNVDIEGFFPSTGFAQVHRVCRQVDGGSISKGAARLLAEICCFRGALPTGAPTSPAVANMVLRPADTAIAKAAEAHGIRYTRYADDLTFSGEGDTKRIIPFVQKILAQLGYRLDQRKTQLYRRGRQQLVTNLVVNEKVNLRRSERRRLRAAVHRRCRGAPVVWHGKPMDDHALKGRLALLGMVDRRLSDQLVGQLKAHAPSWGSQGA